MAEFVLTKHNHNVLISIKNAIGAGTASQAKETFQFFLVLLQKMVRVFICITGSPALDALVASAWVKLSTALNPRTAKAYTFNVRIFIGFLITHKLRMFKCFLHSSFCGVFSKKFLYSRYNIKLSVGNKSKIHSDGQVRSCVKAVQKLAPFKPK